MMTGIEMIVIYLFAFFGLFCSYMILKSETEGHRRKLKERFVKKYIPKFKIGDIIYVVVDDGKRKILCKVINRFVDVDRKTKIIEKTYFLEPLKFGLGVDVNIYDSYYGYEYFDRMPFYEVDLNYLY